MSKTWEASQRNLTELFQQVVAEYQGAIKIETNFPRWEEQPNASTLTPRLYFYYLGSPDPQYIAFSRALFDDCANDDNTEDLAKAENIIRKRFDLFLENRRL
jgi:hypothetical protein